MASAEFERFRFSFFDDENSARDGLATSALAQLQGEEAARAEEILIGLLPDAHGRSLASASCGHAAPNPS
jgi:hypothetical protein